MASNSFHLGAFVKNFDSSDEVMLSCAIMAHPDRSQDAQELAQKIEEISPQIIFDSNPGGVSTTFRTAHEAWSSVPPWATHHLVLQDDALPCANMVSRLKNVLKNHPKTPISLFCEWGSGTAVMLRWALMSGHGLAQCVDKYVPTVGLVLPASMARALSEERDPESQIEPDDEVIAKFLNQKRITPFTVVPNLIEHGGDESLVGNGSRMGTRRSAKIWNPQYGEINPKPLYAPAKIPLIAWQTGRSALIQWDTETQERKSTVRLFRRELEDAGLPHSLLIKGIDAQLDSPRGQLLESEVGYGFLHELWMVSVATAVFSPTDIANSQPSDEIVISSLESLPAGALRTVMPKVLYDQEVLSGLTELVHDGFFFGYSNAPNIDQEPNMEGLKSNKSQ